MLIDTENLRSETEIGTRKIYFVSFEFFCGIWDQLGNNRLQWKYAD